MILMLISTELQGRRQVIMTLFRLRFAFSLLFQEGTDIYFEMILNERFGSFVCIRTEIK